MTQKTCVKRSNMTKICQVGAERGLVYNNGKMVFLKRKNNMKKMKKMITRLEGQKQARQGDSKSSQKLKYKRNLIVFVADIKN